MNLQIESSWYPPSKYFFKPMYNYLRRETGNKYYAIVLTYSASVLMHATPLIAFGKIDTKIGIFGLSALALSGFIKTGVSILSDNSRKKRLEEILD